jgi:hypothetical protein
LLPAKALVYPNELSLPDTAPVILSLSPPIAAHIYSASVGSRYPLADVFIVAASHVVLSLVGTVPHVLGFVDPDMVYTGVSP